MENYKKITKIGNNEIVFETGKVARQATGAVLVSSGNTQVLSTVVVPETVEEVDVTVSAAYVSKAQAENNSTKHNAKQLSIKTFPLRLFFIYLYFCTCIAIDFKTYRYFFNRW